jgi:hypothetical protein
MNAADLDHYMHEVMRIQNQNPPFAKAWLDVSLFVAEYWIVIALLSLVWSALHFHAVWTNLRDNRGIDRLTWLMVIWMPFGIFFYWRLGRDITVATTLGPPSGRYTIPPLPTAQDTAAAITAALEDESRRRRQARS